MKDQLDLVPPKPCTSSTGRAVGAVCAWTGGSAPDPASKPLPARCSGAVAATDAISPTSYACTIAARPIVRMSLRALPIRPSRAGITSLGIGAPTGADGRLLSICGCDMSHPST
jgi:hypothetical protein